MFDPCCRYVEVKTDYVGYSIEVETSAIFLVERFVLPAPYHPEYLVNFGFHSP